MKIITKQFVYSKNKNIYRRNKSKINQNNKNRNSQTKIQREILRGVKRGFPRIQSERQCNKMRACGVKRCRHAGSKNEVNQEKRWSEARGLKASGPQARQLRQTDYADANAIVSLAPLYITLQKHNYPTQQAKILKANTRLLHYLFT